MADEPATVSAVSIKLPPFWPADPEVWFAQVDAQFTTRGITAQKTKFDYVVSSLSPTFAVEVRDLLLRPPAESPYDALRVELIKRTATSEQHKLQQLISGENWVTVNRLSFSVKCSNCWVTALGSSSDATSFLRELLLQRLPANVRMVLASADASMDLSKLADMADKVIEVSTPSVAAISGSGSDSSNLGQLQEEIARLTALVKSLSSRELPQRGRSPSRSRRSNPRYRRTPSPARLTDGPVCWYHERYGVAAKKCKDPCSWGNFQAGP